jgi:hypothetical protein
MLLKIRDLLTVRHYVDEYKKDRILRNSMLAGFQCLNLASLRIYRVGAETRSNATKNPNRTATSKASPPIKLTHWPYMPIG